MRILLASASPRRRELLAQAGIRYEVCPADVEEIIPEKLPAEQQSEYLALLKADAVAKSYPEALVIGADTTVICDGRVLGKPKDTEDACRMLRFLSGRVHKVCTGVALLRGGQRESFTSVTEVCFYELSEAEIRAYAESGEPLDKAGAYGIQGLGAMLVKEIRGDYFTVVGLPLAETVRRIRRFGEQPQD